MRLGSYLTLLLPRNLVVALAPFLGRVLSRRLPERRTVLKCNLDHVLSSVSVSKQAQDRLIQRTFANSVICTYDFLKLPWITPPKLRSWVEVDGREFLDQALAEGKGVVLTTAHLGNWDISGPWLAAWSYRVAGVVEDLPAQVARLYRAYRGRFGMQVITLAEHPLKMYRSLRRGDILALLADRDLAGNGVKVRFFDAHRLIPRGPALLALRTGAPLIFGYIVLAGRKQAKPYQIVIRRIPYCASGNSEADVQTVSQRIADHAAAAIRKHPDQWFVYSPDWQ
jgi:KDO2-lipid IV(A) lauroyltransferase